ncbi:MAG: hypothetical protein FWD84_01940 [Oscillospiraceae bacterium]|nr:hypothetical protein [Oscillospiraceae bacterium]
MMKHKTIKLVCLGVLVAVAIVMGSIALAQISATDDVLVTHIADIADHPEGYWLRDSEGYLAVYYKGWGHPVFISHVPLASLRGQDRTDVEKGISVATRQELLELLEDFGS